jgi:hypothetical protein
MSDIKLWMVNPSVQKVPNSIIIATRGTQLQENIMQHKTIHGALTLIHM